MRRFRDRCDTPGTYHVGTASPGSHPSVWGWADVFGMHSPPHFPFSLLLQCGLHSRFGRVNTLRCKYSPVPTEKSCAHLTLCTAKKGQAYLSIEGECSTVLEAQTACTWQFCGSSVAGSPLHPEMTHQDFHGALSVGLQHGYVSLPDKVRDGRVSQKGAQLRGVHCRGSRLWTESKRDHTQSH